MSQELYSWTSILEGRKVMFTQNPFMKIFTVALLVIAPARNIPLKHSPYVHTMVYSQNKIPLSNQNELVILITTCIDLMGN